MTGGAATKGGSTACCCVVRSRQGGGIMGSRPVWCGPRARAVYIKVWGRAMGRRTAGSDATGCRYRKKHLRAMRKKAEDVGENTCEHREIL